MSDFLNPMFNGAAIRELEAHSIRDFLYDRRRLFGGHVLDFGCGAPGSCHRPRPYEDIVRAGGGTYFGYDPAAGQSLARFLLGPYDAILCTQVLEYTLDPKAILVRLRQACGIGGHLVLTYATTWTETGEPNDYWRFTRNGMELLLAESRWTLVEHTDRVKIDVPDWPLWLGHGVVARCSEL